MLVAGYGEEPVEVEFRSLRPGEERALSDFVLGVFGEFVAPLYSREGQREFAAFVNPDLFRRRAQSGYFVLVAVAGDEIVGMLEMREHEHISLLFVDGRLHGQGIGRELLRRALAEVRQRRPGVREVTVNSAPGAVSFYERLGFRATGPEMTVNGIIFTPMAKSLATREGG